MKKIIIALAALFMVISIQAQVADKPAMSKEEKEKTKLKKEQDLNDAIKQLGLSLDDDAKLRDILKDADTKSRDLKGNTTITEEQRAASKKVITDEKNARLKALLGEEKYKQWNDIRNKQKAASAPQQ